MEQNYEKAFKMLCEQIRTEYEWSIELKEKYRGLNEFDKTLGMIFAYSSLKRTCENIEKYGAEEYERLCDETAKKYGA